MISCAALLGLGALTGHADAPETSEHRTIRGILDRWLDACGGARTIAELQSIDYRCTIDSGAGPPIEAEMRADRSGNYRCDLELPRFGRLTQAWDHQHAWQRNATLGFGLLSPTENVMNQISSDVRRTVHDAVYALESATLLPDEVENGRKMRVLELKDGNAKGWKWYFEDDTGRRVRQEMRWPGGGRVMVGYDDFRRVPGTDLVEPFHLTRIVNNQRTDIRLRDIFYNIEIDPELFATPDACLSDEAEINQLFHLNRHFCGEQAMAGIRTRVTKSMVEITTAGTKFPVKTSVKRPNYLVEESEVPGLGPSLRGFDGKVGWEWNELQGYRTMRGEELAQVTGSANLDGPLELSAGCPLRKMLEETTEGNRRIVGLALSSLGGPVGNYYFDTRTGELVRVETFVPAGPSGELKITAEFSDYRKVDGVMLPFVTVVTNPALRMVTTVQSVEQNIPLDDTIFVPRKD